ncbi:S41 family peptidase [Shinella sumterensis]|uniref:S41 family peptidase n=1 Tax=Shinella sumterensis TaxID=1967501 RepID=UPI003F827E9F
MRRKFSGFLCGAAAGTLVTVAFGFSNGVFIPDARAASAETYRQLAIFGDVFERVRERYVEEPDDNKLIEGAINGMLSSLDPHSRYANAQDYEDSESQFKGEFGGLGVEVTMENDELKIVSSIDDTPASRAGLRANDVITAINNEPVQGLTLSQAVEKMRGPVDTPITLTILRDKTIPKEDVRLVREVIKVQSVRVQLKGDDIGYIRISQFTQQTFPGLEKGIAALNAGGKEDKLKGYILDLRSNPGGLLDQAINVTDSFIDRGEIVSTRGRNSQEDRSYFATSGDLVNGKPMIVLINGGSASASEIVAGALQDHRRATVLGTRSFGKGTVQGIIPLSGNGALFLTTSRYFTPSGRSIQAKGIDPDIRVDEKVPKELEVRDQISGESSLKGHLSNPQQDTAKDAGQETLSAYIPPDEKDDTQLNAAMRLLRGEETNDFFPPDPKTYTQLTK